MFSLEHKHTASKLRSQQLQQQQPPERGPRVGVGKPGVEFQTAPSPPIPTPIVASLGMWEEGQRQELGYWLPVSLTATQSVTHAG